MDCGAFALHQGKLGVHQVPNISNAEEYLCNVRNFSGLSVAHQSCTSRCSSPAARLKVSMKFAGLEGLEGRGLGIRKAGAKRSTAATCLEGASMSRWKVNGELARLEHKVRSR